MSETGDKNALAMVTNDPSATQSQIESTPSTVDIQPNEASEHQANEDQKNENENEDQVKPLKKPRKKKKRKKKAALFTKKKKRTTTTNIRIPKDNRRKLYRSRCKEKSRLVEEGIMKPEEAMPPINHENMMANYPSLNIHRQRSLIHSLLKPPINIGTSPKNGNKQKSKPKRRSTRPKVKLVRGSAPYNYVPNNKVLNQDENDENKEKKNGRYNLRKRGKIDYSDSRRRKPRKPRKRKAATNTHNNTNNNNHNDQAQVANDGEGNVLQENQNVGNGTVNRKRKRREIVSDSSESFPLELPALGDIDGFDEHDHDRENVVKQEYVKQEVNMLNLPTLGHMPMVKSEDKKDWIKNEDGPKRKRMKLEDELERNISVLGVMNENHDSYQDQNQNGVQGQINFGNGNNRMNGNLMNINTNNSGFGMNGMNGMGGGNGGNANNGGEMSLNELVMTLNTDYSNPSIVNGINGVHQNQNQNQQQNMNRYRLNMSPIRNDRNVTGNGNRANLDMNMSNMLAEALNQNNNGTNINLQNFNAFNNNNMNNINNISNLQNLGNFGGFGNNMPQINNINTNNININNLNTANNGRNGMNLMGNNNAVNPALNALLNPILASLMNLGQGMNLNNMNQTNYNNNYGMNNMNAGSININNINNWNNLNLNLLTDPVLKALQNQS